MDLQKYASDPAQKLHSLLGLILDDGVIGLYCQNIVLEKEGG